MTIYLTFSLYIIYSFKLYVLPTSIWLKNWIALVIIICKGYMYDHNYRLTDCKGSTVEYGVEHSEVTNIPKFCLSKHLKTNNHFSMTCFCVNGLYGKILTKKEPIRMLRFTSSVSYNKIWYFESFFENITQNSCTSILTFYVTVFPVKPWRPEKTSQMWDETAKDTVMYKPLQGWPFLLREIFNIPFVSLSKSYFFSTNQQ